MSSACQCVGNSGATRGAEIFTARVIAAIIDVAGHAAIAAKLRHGVPTIDLRTDYLRMPAGKEPYATAEPVNLGIVDVRITAKQSKLVATSRGLFSTRAG